MAKMIRIAGIVEESIVDGPGIRMAIYMQGCPHNCEGCHNPKTHSPDGGNLMEIETLAKKAEQNPLIKGVTISGGEPFAQIPELLSLVTAIKAIGRNIMIYTGYTFEQLQSISEDVKKILVMTDFLVDGKFIIEQKDLLLSFRGSRNQRIIDVQETLKTGEVVACEL